MDEIDDIVEHKPTEVEWQAGQVHDNSEHLWQHLRAIMLRSVVQEAVSSCCYMPSIDFEEYTYELSVQESTV